MTTVPLVCHQSVTVQGSPAVVFDVYGPPTRPHAYTVEMVDPPGFVDAARRRVQVPADQVAPAPVDLAAVEYALRGVGDTRVLYGVRMVCAEVAYLRRLLELAEDYTRLGARDGAVAAASDALMDFLRSRGELDAEVDTATADGLRELAEAAVLGALPVLAPFADALQELRDLLPGPCPVPDIYDGMDSCPHGVWPCGPTRASWIASGLDPAEEKRRILAAERKRRVAGED